MSQQRCQFCGIVFSPLAAWPCLTEQWLLISQACVCACCWGGGMGNRWEEKMVWVASVRSQPACPADCLYTINELEEGRERRVVLWRWGVSARAFSMTLKSSLSYMLRPRILFLPYPPHTTLPPSVSASQMMMCLVGVPSSSLYVCVLLSFSALGRALQKTWSHAGRSPWASDFSLLCSDRRPASLKSLPPHPHPHPSPSSLFSWPQPPLSRPPRPPSLRTLLSYLLSPSFLSFITSTFSLSLFFLIQMLLCI